MIYDTDGLPVYSAAIALSPNTEETAEIDVRCTEGYRLAGTSVSGLTVTAKHEDAGGWTDIETTPIDLSPWAGSTERFLIKFAVGSIASYDRVSFTLTAEPAG